MDLKQELEFKGYSKSKIEVYIFHLNKFFRYLKKNPKLVNVSDVNNYIKDIKKSGLTNSHINLSINCIKSYFVEILHKKSFNDIKVSDQTNSLVRDDIDLMIRSTNNLELKLLIELVFGSGLSIEEVLKINIKDLNLKKKYLKLNKRYILFGDNFIDKTVEYLKTRIRLKFDSPRLFTYSQEQAEELIKKITAKTGISYLDSSSLNL